MGAFSKELTCSAAYVKSDVSFDVSSLNIKAVGVYCLSGSVPPNDAFLQVTLSDGTALEKSIGTVLCAGYGGSGHGIGWQGSLKTSGAANMFLIVNGATAATYRLTILTE